jgi:GntR family transcriptional regulator
LQRPGRIFFSRLRVLGRPGEERSMTDPLSDRPAYNQVAEHLRQRIYAGELRPGDKLPSETGLIEQFGVSRVTARGAIKDLQAEGLIVTRQGKGSFVRDRNTARRLPAGRYQAELEFATKQVSEPLTSYGFDRAVDAADGERYRVETSYRETRAPGRVAELFGITAGEIVLERRLTFFIEDRPEQLITSYLLPDMVRGTPVTNPDNEQFPVGTIAQLALLGIVAVSVEESVGSRMPTPEEAATLRLAPGVPLLVITRRTLTEGGRVVEVAADILLPADRVILDYRMDLPNPP